MSDLLQHCRFLISGDREVTQRYPYNEIISPLQDAVEQLCDEVERLEAERRWIPVSERLPEDDDAVLICRMSGWRSPMHDYRTAWLEGGLGGRWRVPGGYDLLDDGEEPTHWMPQPAPPTDNCEICGGSQGGVPGNENALSDGTVICDYCHAQHMKYPPILGG